MTRAERANLKKEAQCQLFYGMQTAFTDSQLEIADTLGHNRKLLVAEMDKQMERIERLFGWEVGSWQRGC